MIVVKKSSFLVECLPVGGVNEGGWLDRKCKCFEPGIPCIRCL